MKQRPSPFLLALRSHRQSLQQHWPPPQMRQHRPGPGLLGPPLASSTCASTPPTLPDTCPTHMLAPHTCTQHSKPSRLSCSPSPSRC